MIELNIDIEEIGRGHICYCLPTRFRFPVTKTNKRRNKERRREANNFLWETVVGSMGAVGNSLVRDHVPRAPFGRPSADKMRVDARVLVPPNAESLHMHTHTHTDK